MKGYGEALETVNQLEIACGADGAGDEIDNLVIFRLLHSLKSWAALHHLKPMEEICHRLEEPLRGGGRLNETDRHNLISRSAELRSFLERATPGIAAEAPKSPVVLRDLSLPPLRLSPDQIALIRDLQTDGRKLCLLRIWVSPDEPMLANRILHLQSLIEDHVLILNQLWVWQNGYPSGPLDARLWAQEPGDSVEARGALFIALYANNPNLGEIQERIWIDQVEAIHESLVPPAHTLDANLQADGLQVVPGMTANLALQEMFFQQRRFMPGPRGFSANLHMSYESSWNYQTGLLGEILSMDAGDYLRKLFRQASELPLAKAREDIAATQWRLVVDNIRLPELALRSLSDVLVQLVRNSLAHALESQSQRTQKRKPPAMIIRCAVMAEEDSIVIHYSDDGKGINLDRVLQKVGRSLGEPESDDGLLRIISSPEFSTEDQAKANAGRGIGLNLVDHTVRQILRGELKLQNRLGKGSSFTVRIPRRLSVLDVILCEGQSDTFAVPLVQAASLVALNEHSVDHEEDGKRFFRFAGRCIPFLRNDTFISPLDLRQGSGLVMRRDGILRGIIPIKRIVGYERLLVTIDSETVFSRTLQAWLYLFSTEID